MYRYLNEKNLPKWLKYLLYVVLTLTLVYWLGILIYKILEAFRKFLHWASEKRNYWTFLFSVFIVLLGSLIMAQCVLGLDPLGKLANYIVEMWENIKNSIGNTT